MNMLSKLGDQVYFWWTILSVFGAAALALYAFVVFAMAGDDWHIQLGFALCIAKLVGLIVGAIKALSIKRRYLISTFCVSAIVPCYYFARIVYSRSLPFTYGWSFDDGFVVTLASVDLVEMFLTAARLFKLRTSEVTPWQQ